MFAYASVLLFDCATVNKKYIPKDIKFKPTARSNNPLLTSFKSRCMVFINNICIFHSPT